MSNATAPEGHVYVCSACGKVSRNEYGFTGDDPGPYEHCATPGWDESCVMNEILVEIAIIAEPSGWVFPQRVYRLDEALSQKEVRT